MRAGAEERARARDGTPTPAPQEKPRDGVIVDLGLLLPVGNRTYHAVTCCDDSGGTGTFFVEDLDETVTCYFCERKHRLYSLEEAVEDSVFEPSEGLLSLDAFQMLTFMLRALKEQAAPPGPREKKGQTPRRRAA